MQLSCFWAKVLDSLLVEKNIHLTLFGDFWPFWACFLFHGIMKILSEDRRHTEKDEAQVKIPVIPDVKGH